MNRLFVPVVYLLGLSVLAPCGQAATTVPLRLNAGGGEVKDGEKTWLPASSYVRGGEDYSFGGAVDLSGVKDPAHDSIYATVRHRNHSYHFPELPDGRYLLRLHFTDAFVGVHRAMDYVAGGVRIIQSLNVVNAAGGANRAFIAEAIVEASEGKGLEILASVGSGTDAFECGVEILAAPKDAELTAGPLKIVPSASAASGYQRPESGAELAARLEALSGGHTRIVYTKVVDPHDTCAVHVGELWAIDTRGKHAGEEQRLSSTERSYGKPIFTPDGTRVVFSDQENGRCYVIPAEGGRPKELGRGFASDVWIDPATGIEWVYVRQSFKDTGGVIERFPIDGSGDSEVVWDRGDVGHELVPWFRLSLDGKFAAGAFPWPKCGVADLTEGTWRPSGNGCWVSMAPDNSYRFFHFVGNHTELIMYEAGGRLPRTIGINGIGGLAGQKVYHPRWSNHPRILTVTGPQHSHDAELYIGRFDAPLTRVEEWERVTFNTRADYYGDAWVAPDSSIVVGPPLAEMGNSAPSEDSQTLPPMDMRDLVFLWDNKTAANEIIDPAGSRPITSAITYHGGVVFTRSGGFSFKGGAVELDQETAQRTTQACRKANAITIEAIVRAPHNNYPVPHRLLSLSDGLQTRNFTLGQRGDQWVIRLRTKKEHPNADFPEVLFGPVTPGKDQHIVVTYKRGDLRCYIDGLPTAAAPALDGDFESWSDEMKMVIGDEVFGQRNWEGEAEGLAVWSRALSAGEVDLRWKSAKARLAARIPSPPALAVEAELIASAETADPFLIAPYTRSLTVGHYRIKNVIEGKLDAKEIAVARWGILSGVPQPDSAKPGDVVTLYLEPWDAHPQFKSEHQQTLPAADLLPKYYFDSR